MNGSYCNCYVCKLMGSRRQTDIIDLGIKIQHFTEITRELPDVRRSSGECMYF